MNSARPGEKSRSCHPLLRVDNLVKSHQGRPALRGISLEATAGEILAFLGPNGAGKSTSIHLLTGMARPDSGAVFYAGEPFDPEDPRQKLRLGVVPQQNNLDRDLTVAQSLKAHGLLFGLRGRELASRIEEMLVLADLREQAGQKAGTLSGGQKRRLVIVRALLHRPEILFWDEPSTGLDPLSRRALHALIRGLNREAGVLVFLTTHYIEEADQLAHRVIFIDRGKIVVSGQPADLKAAIGGFALEYMEEDQSRCLYFSGREEALAAAADLAAEVRVRAVNLEDVYLKCTGRKMESDLAS